MLGLDWLRPEWPAPESVRAIFTSRHGGVSAPPFNSFNLAEHVGDAAQSVASNRQRLAQVVGAKPVFLQQVHGINVLAIDQHTPHGLCADACFTRVSQTACSIMVADCLPVLLCRMDGTMVAAVHAGWRGLASGVLAAAVETFQVEPPVLDARNVSPATDSNSIIAWLGPCIGPAEFEVGPEVKAAFAAMPLIGPASASCFKAGAKGKYLADLPSLARLQLAALGVLQVYGNDGGDGWCTVKQESRYFSHRRDTGVNGLASTGRMLACIWIER
jgi:hypothetical protein